MSIQEGRLQRYGTQWFQDAADSYFRTLFLADAERVNPLRSQVGLGTNSAYSGDGACTPIGETGGDRTKQPVVGRWYIQKGWRN
jgi:hypothetical protein